MPDFANLDATAQAELVREKAVTPIELLEAATARIERLNPQLNAVILPMYELAAKAAKGPLPDGPFTGVPFLLKDLTAAYAGVPMTFASSFTREYVPRHDSHLVERYKRAGLVICGKTNAPEFGIICTTEPRLFGPTKSPWDLSRSVGGSSGGSAAAVAAGMVPMAHANDGGGSIRIPASCCGVFGLKPTRGRITLGPDLGDIMHGFVNEHAVTRSVRDSAALLDATEGPAVGDPYVAPPKARPYVEEARTPPGRLKIAVARRPLNGVKVHADCLAGLDATAMLLGELGHVVEEASFDVPGHELLSHAFMAVWAGGTVTAVDGFAYLMKKKPTPEQFEPLTWALYELGRQQPLSQYLLADAALQGIARALVTKMHAYDVWLTPTLAEPPAPLGAFDSTPESPMAGMFRAAEYTPFTPLCNVTGLPAMSVPLHWNAAGLPIGMHFIGRFGDEGTLFRLAAQLEKARPWADRRPPISA